MNKEQARTSTKRVQEEASRLLQSPLITLFEIDLSEIAIDETLAKNIRLGTDFSSIPDMKFYFHNNINTMKAMVGSGATLAPEIWWGAEPCPTSSNPNLRCGTNQRKYIAAPIMATGFEVSSKGTLPRPKLSITVSEQGVEFMSIFKGLMKDLGDLSNAKVTRIRTFAKYLDNKNFYFTDADDNIIQPAKTKVDNVPEDHTPDSYAELPRDVYFIDRKSMENKQALEFELSSILELDGMVLPSRLIAEKRCTFQYRGEGCCYEYGVDNNNNQCNTVANWKKVHGKNAKLPNSAPPVANEKDELLGGNEGVVRNKRLNSDDYYGPGAAASKPSCWQKNVAYAPKTVVYITVGGINYYYVAKFWDCTDAENWTCSSTSVPSNEPPPNSKYWAPDTCSKTLKGCKARWAAGTFTGDSASNPYKSATGGNHLPFGGWPGINR